MKKRDGIREILESGQCPGVVIKGEGRKGHHGNPHVDQRYAAPNANFRARGAKAQEKVDKQVHQARRRQAQETRRHRHMTKRKDDEVRPIGQIPFNLYAARRRQHGKDYWKDGGKDVLKRDGLLFDS